MLRVGFADLGAMDAPMARNLHKAGLLVAVWNRTADKAQALAAETGCRAARDIAEIASLCDAVVICVAADADVLQVVEKLALAQRAGSLVIDCSTVSAGTARRAAEILAA